MKHSAILLSSILGGCLLLLPRHGAAAVIAPGRREHEAAVVVGRRRPRSAFDGRMRRRAGDKTTTRSTSIELSRGGAVAVVVVVDSNDPNPTTTHPRDEAAEILPPLARIALGAAVQTGLLYALAGRLDALGTFTRASALLAIVFGSSYFGSVVDAMGSSAATRQVLDPNRIPGDADWYAGLKKPRWNPPGWVFPIMWLVVSKPTQFAAVWRLIAGHSKNDEGGTLLSVPLLAYCAHLSLGDAWNKVFFGTESTGRGLVVICAFWSVLWLSGYLFYRADPYAGLLLLPTCLWVTVAAALNWAIYLLNGEKRGVR